jgi:predicted nucleic-acid-binding protein
MIFLDTNIFIRYFEQEDEKKALDVEKLFERLVDGRVSCFTNSMVIAEIVWTLEKYYEWEKEEVCENIEIILNTPNIRIASRNIIKNAISTYKNTNIDYIDSYNHACIKAHDASQIYSYDQHFDGLDDLERLIP